MRGDEKPLSRGEARIAKIQQARLVSKTVAKSVAHLGVVARPMDKQLSKILDMKRADAIARGTSVRRMGESVAEDREALVEANSEKTAVEQGTSVGRLRTAEGDMGLQKTALPTEPPDMAI